MTRKTLVSVATILVLILAMAASASPTIGVLALGLMVLASPAARAQSNGVLREIFTQIGGSSLLRLTNYSNFPKLRFHISWKLFFLILGNCSEDINIFP